MFKKLIASITGAPEPKAKSPVQASNELVYKVRVEFHKGLRTAIRKTQGGMTEDVAECVSNYIFEFGDFGFELGTGNDLKRAVADELTKVCTYPLIAPPRLCQAMVHRALQLKISFDDFEKHMRDLWLLRLVPVGPFTPVKESFPLKQQHPLQARLAEIPVSEKQVQAALQVWKDDSFVAAANAWLADQKAARIAKAKADSAFDQ